jgi:hypothetical protein
MGGRGRHFVLPIDNHFYPSYWPTAVQKSCEVMMVEIRRAKEFPVADLNCQLHHVAM